MMTTEIDLKTLCNALGFAAIAMQGNKLPKKYAAQRATAVAMLIEEFCLVHNQEHQHNRGTSKAIAADDQSLTVDDRLQRMQDLITEMSGALELCLECEGLTWEAEQEAEVLILRSKRWLP